MSINDEQDDPSFAARLMRELPNLERNFLIVAGYPAVTDGRERFFERRRKLEIG
jgi:hypothetical protein